MSKTKTPPQLPSSDLEASLDGTGEAGRDALVAQGKSWEWLLCECPYCEGGEAHVPLFEQVRLYWDPDGEVDTPISDLPLSRDLRVLMCTTCLCLYQSLQIEAPETLNLRAFRVAVRRAQEPPSDNSDGEFRSLYLEVLTQQRAKELQE